MIFIALSDDQEQFLVKDPDGNDITNKYEGHRFVIKTEDGRDVLGFFIGQEVEFSETEEA